MRLLEPKSGGHLQWPAAFGAGFIAGAILLIVPRGSPWSSVTFFSPMIVGRVLRGVPEMPFVFVWLIHLGVSVVYGLIISRLIAVLTKSRAILTGGIIGLALYLLNLLVVSLVWRQLRGNEVSVLFTHVVFGLIAAGAYRGLLKRTASPIAPAP